jgi:flagellin
MAFRINHNIPALNALRHLDDTNEDMSRTLERLSSGQKVNRGADGPAVLVISEQMRGQIASIDQAIRNSESSISMVQTAEATLSEFNNLLVSVRQRAIHAANEGANDENMLAADQAEVKNALDTMDRIARTSQFGTRTLFDGSNGANGVAVGEGLEFVSATPQTRNSPAEGYVVDITATAVRAEKRGQRALELSDFIPAVDDSDQPRFEISLSEGGRNITFTTDGTKDGKAIDNILSNMEKQPTLFPPERAVRQIQEFVVQRLQRMVNEGGLKLDVFLDVAEEGSLDLDGPSRVLVVRHKEFGSEHKFNIAGTVPKVLNTDAEVIEQSVPGRDVEGTIDGHIGLGRGEFLVAPKNTDPEGMMVKFNSARLIKRRVPKFITGSDGSTVPNPEIRELSGLVLPISGSRHLGREDEGNFTTFTWEVPAETEEGEEGFVHVSQNSLAFQVGPARGSQVRISLLDMKTTELAKGIPNMSGFRNLGEIDVTTSQGALDTIQLVDDAISNVSSVRADLGAFQKNTLESNTSNLRVANENLTSAESSLRDADMAEEITRFTRNQIMMSAGVAMLAQANQTPKSVLQLLNSGPQ